MSSDDAKQCPWCQRWCLKDTSCNYIFACGLDSMNIFHIGKGCGKSWCWECGKRFCGQYMDAFSGIKNVDAKENHDSECCKKENGFTQEEYCPGNHNSHCSKRW